MMNGLETVEPRSIQTVLVCRYSSMACWPLSRPMPERFTPPKGAMKLTAR